MSEMIERVARASFDFWKSTQPGKENLEFEHLNNIDDEFALAHARAIIEAMGEPSDAMTNAAALVWDWDQYTETNALNMWQTMIDEALK